jgi:predicted PurR-regulated permease PerM
MSDRPSPDAVPGALRFRRTALLLIVAGISVLFLLVVKSFLLAVFLAAIFAGLSLPLYRWIVERFRGRKRLAAIFTILVLMGGVGIPLAGFLVLVANEAVQVAQGAEGWVRGQEGNLERLGALVERIPFAANLMPEGTELLEHLKEIAGRTGSALLGTLAAATRGTLGFFLQVFILLYALYFFLVDGRKILRTFLYYIPLSSDEEEQLLERFVSVSRATLKGSLLIGILQGGVAGLAFWVAGVPGSAFWGTVMVVLSIIPAVGAALVWVPAVIYLFMVGQTMPALGLLVWCATVVSLLDNFLRPRFIGRDAKMSDLLILLSTLGGIFLFGAVGFIVGPIVAALFVTVWHIFGEAFHEWLPEAEQVGPGREEAGADSRGPDGEGSAPAAEGAPAAEAV